MQNIYICICFYQDESRKSVGESYEHAEVGPLNPCVFLIYKNDISHMRNNMVVSIFFLLRFCKGQKFSYPVWSGPPIIKIWKQVGFILIEERRLRNVLASANISLIPLIALFYFKLHYFSTVSLNSAIKYLEVPSAERSFL